MLRLTGLVPVVAILLLLFAPQSKADIISEINAEGAGVNVSTFAILYEGTGSSSGQHNQLHIAGALGVTNINGNIGIASGGSFAGDGSGTITPGNNVYFSAANSGQCATSGGFGYNCSSALYSQSSITNDLSAVASFSSGVASGLSVSTLDLTTSGQSAMITAGTGGSLDGHGNSVFTATSFELASGTMLTINGDAAGDNVIINIGNCTTGGAVGSVCNFDGTINLVGIAADHVLFNITGSNELKIDGANVAGDFVDVNGQIFVSASTVIGRLYGGDSERFQLVSGVDVNPFGRTPEPAALVLAGTVLLGLLPLLRRRFRRAAPNA